MTNGSELQNAYINLYKELRRYVWDYMSIRTLAELEVSTFTRFPDVDDIRKYLNIMKVSALNVARDDEDLMNAFDDFYYILDSCETSSSVFAKLSQVQEVLA